MVKFQLSIEHIFLVFGFGSFKGFTIIPKGNFWGVTHFWETVYIFIDITLDKVKWLIFFPCDFLIYQQSIFYGND